MTPDPAAFIRDNLPLTEVPGTGVRLHLAGPGSGLGRLVPPGGAPYWAHAWPGGVALALHLRATGAAAGRRVMEWGQGSGLAAIAALLSSAASAAAYDPDPLAAVATRLNARANGVAVLALGGTPEQGARSLLSPRRPGGASAPPDCLVLAGDTFYDAAVASASRRFLDAAAALGAAVLVGDLGRPHLPLDRLDPLASYPVRDLGDPPRAPARAGRVFRWRPP